MQIHRRRLILVGRIVFAAALAASVMAAAAASAAVSSAAAGAPADLLVTGGKIYTVDSARSVVEAMAVRGGKIVFAGSAADAKRWIGPDTKIEQLAGGLVPASPPFSSSSIRTF